MFDSLRPHVLQNTMLPCPSPTPRANSNSCALSWWCHPTISSFIIPFSSCLQSLLASGSFLKSQFLTSSGQSIGASASAISPSSEYSGLISFRMDWLDLLSVQGTLKSLLQHSSKASLFQCSVFFMVQLSHPYVTTGKTIALTRQIFVSKVMSLLFNTLSSFSSKEQTSFNFVAAVIIWSSVGAQENRFCHCFHCFPIYLPSSDGTRCHDLSFLNVELI